MEVTVEGGFPCFAAQPLGHCATSKGSSYTENEYDPFFKSEIRC